MRVGRLPHPGRDPVQAPVGPTVDFGIQAIPAADPQATPMTVRPSTGEKLKKIFSKKLKDVLSDDASRARLIQELGGDEPAASAPPPAPEAADPTPDDRDPTPGEPTPES